MQRRAEVVGGSVFSYGTARPGGYCSSIQRASIAPAFKKSSSLIFGFGNLSGSSSSTDSSCSTVSVIPSPGSADARAASSSSLNEIAGQMVQDGYTRGLIQAFSEAAVGDGGANHALKSLLSELDVAWVLEINLPELAVSAAADDLVQRWIRALTVMVQILYMTWSDVQDDLKRQAFADRKRQTFTASVVPTVAGMVPCSSAPVTATGGHHRGDGMSVLSVKSVREAMAAYSIAQIGSYGANLVVLETQFEKFAKASLLKMLSFADAMAGVGKTRENLLRMLDVYASIWDSYPVILRMFRQAPRDIISAKIESIFCLLSDGLRTMISDVKAWIGDDDSHGFPLPPGGDIHRTTLCAMNDIMFLLHNYRSVSIVQQQQQEEDDDEEHQHHFVFEFQSFIPLSDLILELIPCLEDSVAKKSSMYSDRSLGYIFLLNNLHFILKQVEATELFSAQDEANNKEEEEEEDYYMSYHYVNKAPMASGLSSTSPISNRKKKIQRCIKRYVDSSWVRVLSALSSLPSKDCWPYGPGRRSSSSSLAKFNSEFQRTYSTHKLWKVADPKLKKRLREIITSKVVQDYAAHLCSYPDLKNSAAHTPADMRKLLTQLFEG